MAASDAMYSKVPSGDREPYRQFSPYFAKSGIALIAGSCLVLLSIVAVFACSLLHPSTSVDNSITRLIGVQSFLRTPHSMTLQARGDLLPGASPWKELALAGIQEASRCGRDVSMNANAVKNVLVGMSSKSKAAVNVVVRAVAAKVKEPEEKYVKKTPEEILKAGATGPLGFWDPVGFATDLPEGRLLFYREVELKHGRVCMLASLGFLVAEKFHPLFGGDIDVPSYVAFQATPLQSFWIAVAVAIAIPEILLSIPTFNEPGGDGFTQPYGFTMKTNRVPGDLAFDPLGLKPKNEDEFLELQNKELNNGRLAMISIAGMIGQELATGQKLFS